jgi:uncharacterized protein YndB with AHSA1/START domain
MEDVQRLLAVRAWREMKSLRPRQGGFSRRWLIRASGSSGGERRGRFQTTHMESDLRPGGTWLMRGIGADGKHFTVRGEYRAIERPRLLEFTWLPDWQEDAPLTLVRFDLEKKDGSTTVRLTHSGHTTERSRESHRSWQRILARLQGYVEEKVLN